MLEIYGTDVPRFKKEDWEDALGTEAFPASADWGGWNGREPIAFAIRETEETRDLPVREFVLDLKRKDAEPIEMPKELDYLLSDIWLMKRAGSCSAG